MRFGVQLYNFRKELSEDYRGTLREIAKLGFDGVEFAMKYGGIAPDELAALTNELGLKCAGTMFTADELLDSGNVAYQYASRLASPAVTISAFCDFATEWNSIAECCAKIGAIATSKGLVFSYHNHWAEGALVDDTTALDKILGATKANEVLLEPDVCWLTRAGIEPVSFISKFTGRIRQIHLKDSKQPDDKQFLTELGKGIVNIEGVCRIADKVGAQWLIYEQDVTEDPFRSAEISLKYLKGLGL